MITATQFVGSYVIEQRSSGRTRLIGCILPARVCVLCEYSQRMVA
jgi:hypothetical protein